MYATCWTNMCLVTFTSFGRIFKTLFVFEDICFSSSTRCLLAFINSNNNCSWSMAPDLFAIKGHLEQRKEFSKIGNYKISISLQSSVDRIPISHCGAQFSINDPAIVNWVMIDLFTDCLRKFAKTYYVDVQNCGLMITIAIMINLFTDYLRKHITCCRIVD